MKTPAALLIISMSQIVACGINSDIRTNSDADTNMICTERCFTRSRKQCTEYVDIKGFKVKACEDINEDICRPMCTDDHYLENIRA